MVDRRTALRIAAAATMGTATGLVSQRSLAAAPVVSQSRIDWASLTRGLSARATLYRRGEASYETLNVPFNHRYANIRAAAILVPETVEDIRRAVTWARDQGINLTPRTSLGHNYAGYSTTEGLLLLLTRMRDISVRPASRPRLVQRYGPLEVVHNAGVVTTAAGVINADMLPLLTADGVFVPAGRCPTVGLAGLVLGGGIGFSDKMFGLTCDRLVATTIVLADGRVVTCDEQSEPDLFWACRGGAGNNFGVNTSFSFRYELLRGLVTYYRLRWDIDVAVPALTALQAIAVREATNRQFDCRIGAGTSGLTATEIVRNAQVNGTGIFYGSASELTRILQPVLELGTPAQQAANRASIREIPPAEAATLLSATTPVEQFGAKSAVLGEPLTEAQLETVVNALLTWPGSRNPDGSGIALFGLGGRVNEVPSDATAFVHRDGLFVLAAETAWADADPPELGQANLDWLDRFYRELFQDARPRGAYQNFPDPDLADWRHAYYGANYPRLVEVKRAYDPTDFFTYRQGIGARHRR